MSREFWYLTPRQWDVLDRTAQGLTQKEIAYDLGCSIQTVKNHLSRIYAMLEVTTAIGALRVAGYIEDRSALRRLTTDVGRELAQLEGEIAAAEARVGELRERFDQARRALRAEPAA